MKYQAMSETVLKAVGGKENITSVTHCATRLRIDARDTSIIDLQLAKSADQALGAVVSGGQLQVIIGPNVTEAYNDFLDFAGIEVGGGTVADDAQTAKDLAEGIKSGNTAMGLIEKFRERLCTGIHAHRPGAHRWRTHSFDQESPGQLLWIEHR